MKGAALLVYRWVLGTAKAAQSRLRSLSKLHIVTPMEHEGNTPGTVVGVPAGGVVVPTTDLTSHDGMGFISADAIPAEYDSDEKQAYVLDALGKRHKNVLPFILHENLELANEVTGLVQGVIVRGVEFGTEGLKRNIFYPAAGKLIAHHLQPEPPKQSSLVYDVDGRSAGIHYQWRVVRWVKQFCQGATGVAEKIFAVALNFTRNGDGTAAHGLAAFKGGRSFAVLSQEAGGPLRPADDRQHMLGETPDGQIHQGANDIDVLYGPVRGFYGPEEVVDEQWESGGKGPFIKRVEKRPDFNDKHTNACGKRVPLVIKFQTWSDWNSYPTHPRIPPPGDPGPPIDEDPKPKKPITGPKPKTFVNATIDTPDHPLGAPTTETPNEIGIPSEYGHVVPNTPDERGVPDSVAGEAVISAKLPGHDFTLEQFLSEPRVGHAVYLPVYKSNTAATTGPRWPAELTTTGKVIKDAGGNIIGNQRSTSSGGKITLAPEMERLHAYVANKEAWPTSLSAFYTIFGAGKNVAGTEFIGGFGIGLRVPNTYLPASGWYFKLDYTDSTTLPDIDLRSTDADGLDASTGRVLKINGTALSGLTGNEVTAASVFAAANRVLVADGNDRSADDSDFTMTQDGSNVLRTANAGDISFDSRNFTNVGTIASGKHTIDLASTNAIAQSIGENSTTGPWEDKYPVEFLVSSSSATFDIPTATDSTYIVTLELAFERNTAGSVRGGAIYEKACWHNEGGTPAARGSIIGPMTVDPGSLGVTAVLSASGTNIRLTVTDSSGDTIRVRGFVTVSLCGSGA